MPGDPIAIPSIANLRDIGGLPTRSGAVLRTGVALRSASLANVADEDVPALAALGLRTVFDLRMLREQEQTPDRLPDGVRHIAADVIADWTEGGPRRLFALFEDPARAGELLGDGRAEAMWVEQWRRFVTLPSARGAYASLFRALADPAQRPVLVHCATGKDRTGWAAGAIQLFLGVPEDLVLAHCLESRAHLAPVVEPMLAQFAARGGDPGLLRPIMDVLPAYLEAAMDEVGRVHGSIEAYVADGLGITAAEADRIRDAFGL